MDGPLLTVMSHLSSQLNLFAIINLPDVYISVTKDYPKVSLSMN